MSAAFILLLAGGIVAAPPIISHDVMYCASFDVYKFDIHIDGEWDFGTTNGEGERATSLVYLLGPEAPYWNRRVEVVGASAPFRAEIRMGGGPGDPLITSSPIRSYDPQAGRLQFTIPTWAFGAGVSRDLEYSVLVAAYGEGAPVMGASYRSNDCIPVATESLTWGNVKALYR